MAAMKHITSLFTKKNALFISIFALVGLAALQIQVAQLEGSKAAFTVYDMFAPIAGSFIGALPGIVAVFLMQLVNFFIHGAEVLDAGTIIRFFPMLFAVWYFAQKGKFNFIIPAIAIIAFVAHPIGREVWYFALFWLIPVVMYFMRDQFLIARALGSTFTAHAVGGSLWIWAFAMPAEIWISIIPLVALERLIFAFGIVISYVGVTNLIAYLEKKDVVNLGFNLNQKYILKSLREENV